jgi:hypothetical protein
MNARHKVLILPIEAENYWVLYKIDLAKKQVSLYDPHGSIPEWFYKYQLSMMEKFLGSHGIESQRLPRVIKIPRSNSWACENKAESSIITLATACSLCMGRSPDLPKDQDSANRMKIDLLAHLIKT